MTDPKLVTLASQSPNISMTVLLDSAGAVVSGGYGGWDIIARPRRQALTHWAGRNPFSMSVSIILDSHMEGGNIESQCSRLERFALPHPNPGGTPPVLRVSGRAIPHDDLSWVVDTIEWGDTIRDSSGYRTRQFATVNLIRYVQADKIQVTAAANARGKVTATVRTVDVRQNDTLTKIAARELGDGKRWHEIQKLNPSIRDPNNLKGISKVKIPPK